MVQYDRKVLNHLLDSYENSRLFTGENKVNISIEFPFNKKKIPAYFDESSYEYERIHSAMQELEEQGYIRIVWKRGKENHIISKVVLIPEQIERAYQYVKRVPKADLVASNIAMLKECQNAYDTPVCRNFISYLLKRLQANQSVKEFVELSDMGKTRQLLQGVFEIERNKRQCYLKEFSIEVFHDSKVLQNMSGRLGKVFRRFGEDFGENGLDVRDTDEKIFSKKDPGEKDFSEKDFGEKDFAEKDFVEILAEYGIYHTPNYVHLKGQLSFRIYETEFDLANLKQGIGISGEDLFAIRFCEMSAIKRVITIENLTTFFRWEEPESLIIYLGGYHNAVRRALLKAVYEALPDAEYYHFGDIDAGGFEIYRDLCQKTGIPFEMYRMNLDTLKAYQEYGRELTENDRIRLRKILERNAGETEEICEVIRYMLEWNVKLEQECVVG